MAVAIGVAGLGAGPAGAQAPVPGELIERVRAVVEGEIITQTDLDAAITLGLVQAAGADPEGAALQTLIDRQLALREVRRYVPLDPTEAAVDARLATLRDQFATPGAWAAALERFGLDEGRLRERIRDDLRMAAYLDERFPLPPRPSPDEVRAYYQEHQSEFQQEAGVAPLAAVEAEIEARLREDRRAALVAAWLSGLERRAEVRVPAPRPSPSP